MDAEARRTAFAEAKAQSLDALERTASIEVVHRDHDGDQYLTAWSRGMPKKPPPPTIEQVRQMIADELAAQPRALTPADVERKVADALPGVGTIIHEVRQQLRKEFAAEIEKLRDEHDVRISALLQATQKLERGLGGDRGEVIDLPNPLGRKRSA